MSKTDEVIFIEKNKSLRGLKKNEIILDYTRTKVGSKLDNKYFYKYEDSIYLGIYSVDYNKNHWCLQEYGDFFKIYGIQTILSPCFSDSIHIFTELNHIGPKITIFSFHYGVLYKSSEVSDYVLINNSFLKYDSCFNRIINNYLLNEK